ncbi:MAG: hypothetical protein GU343_00075 [Nanoarchaeota archaeon]|jgi:hypothetical protein|nr:hypothetical protein [Nanoarchaeota archaeon]
MPRDEQSRSWGVDNKRLDELLYYLPRAVATYLLDGEIKKVNIVDQGPSSLTIEYTGMAYSRKPSLEGENIEEKRKLEGKLTINRDDWILHLKIKKGGVKNKKAYDSKEEMNIDRYKRKKRSLINYLGELAKENKVLSLAILYLESQSYLEGIDIKDVEIEYNMLKNEYKIKVCGDVIEPKSSADIFKTKKCIYLETKSRNKGIELNIHDYSEYEPILLKDIREASEILKDSLTNADEMLRNRYNLNR